MGVEAIRGNLATRCMEFIGRHDRKLAVSRSQEEAQQLLTDHRALCSKVAEIKIQLSGRDFRSHVHRVATSPAVKVVRGRHDYH